MSHVFYTILGLGSSDYSHFQGAPRFLDDRLACLGGKRFYTRAEADEATSLEIVIEPWIEGLPTALRDIVKELKSFGQEKVRDLLATGKTV